MIDQATIVPWYTRLNNYIQFTDTSRRSDEGNLSIYSTRAGAQLPTYCKEEAKMMLCVAFHACNT